MSKTIFSIALNHKSQMEHWIEKFNEAPYKEPPVRAVWFLKPRNTFNVNNGEIVLDRNEEYFSGGTLAITIGKTATKVKAENFSEYVEGFALANEISLAEVSFYRPAIKAKCQDNSCPVGSVKKDLNISNLEIKTYVNGQLVDTWSVSDLVRCPARILEELSDFATLQPSDQILIGTPLKRAAIKPGDVVEIKADGFETLVTNVK